MNHPDLIPPTEKGEPFRVFFVEGGDSPGHVDAWQMFRCRAASREEAAALCLEQGTTRIVAEVMNDWPHRLTQRERINGLHIGGEVWWEDPDRSLASCHAILIQISAAGEPTENSPVVLRRPDGTTIEALFGECH